MGKNINSLLKNAREAKHNKVIKLFFMLDEVDRLDEAVMMAYADSLYELGNDVAALGTYLTFCMQNPESKAVDTALLGAAMALKNLDLQEEGFFLLKSITPTHQGVDKEIAHSCELFSDQRTKASRLGKLALRRTLWPRPAQRRPARDGKVLCV